MNQFDLNDNLIGENNNLGASSYSPYYFNNQTGGIGGSGSPFLGASRPDSPALSNNPDFLTLQRKPS